MQKTKQLPRTNNIGKEEKKAVMRVLNSGILSGFIATSGQNFFGGKEVVKLENAFRKKFGVKHAVAFNSATTALDAALCAVGIGPGDEVIVPPLTMSATATSVLMNMAIPIFADVKIDTFCLDPRSVEENITDRTKAIIIVDLFGGPADYDKLMKIARKYKLKVIEDSAQALGGKYKDKFLGTIGDIGIFSFNQHKTIHCGEGGMLVTNNKKYANRAQLKRNHGEVATDEKRQHEFIVGSNYRMGEIEAAIITEQLKKLDFLNRYRIKLAKYLTKKLEKIDGIITPKMMPGRHVFYQYPFRVEGVDRDKFAKAMDAEGFALNQGYVKPIYLMRLFHDRKIFMNSDFPFYGIGCESVTNYHNGSCPNAEDLWEYELLTTTICRYPLTTEHIDRFVKAVKKVIK
jgi:perosamine synthetase